MRLYMDICSIDGANLYAGLGSPNGVLAAPVGSLFVDKTPPGSIYQNQDGAVSWAVFGSGLYQPLNANLTAIAALTTQAFGRSLLEGVDAAAIRAAIGLNDPSVAAQVVVMPGDVSNATTGLVAATGLSYPVVAGGIYLIEAWIVHTSSLGTNGITVVIADSATAFDGSGAEINLARGVTVGNGVFGIGSAISGNAPLGLATNGTSSGNGYTLSKSSAIWIASGSPPPVGVYFASEGAGNTITVKGGLSMLSALKIN